MNSDRLTSSLLTIAALWRLVFSALTGAAALGLWTSAFQTLPLWQRITLSCALAAAAVASAAGGWWIRRRDHRGRMISLTLDYLGFLTCAIVALNTGGAFLGIDSLADSFGRGIPYLGVLLAGYLLTLLEDVASPQKKYTGLRELGRFIMAVGGLLFLWRIDALQGLLAFLQRLIQPPGPAAAAGLLIFGGFLWALWRRPSAAALGAKASHEQALNGWLFLSPNLLGYLVFFAGPLLLSFYFSFTDSDAFNPPNWVGFDNYARIFNIRFAMLASPDQLAREVIDITAYDEVGRLTLGNSGILFAAADKFFWLALRNTLTFALFVVPLSAVPALFLASILNSKLPGMKFFRAVYFMPSIAAIVGITLVWQWLYNATIGYINYFITQGIGFWNGLLNLSIADPRIQWVSDERTALLAVILISAWQTMGFNTVLFLAGLQNIPGELYEAATVDGAGLWAKFRLITVPMLAPSTFYVVTTTTIQAMQVFEQIFILMNPPEGPNNSTISLVLYLYRSGFQNFRQGYASAIAWVLFIVIFGLTLIQFQDHRRSSIYEN